MPSRRTYPFYVGGPKDGETIVIYPDGQRTVIVPVAELFDIADEPLPDPDYVPYSEHIYRLEDVIVLFGGNEYLSAWVIDGLPREDAAERIWTQLLDRIGCLHV